jgi:hypothetical protein
MGIMMSGCGCSKETLCEDNKFQPENHPSMSKESTSKNCDSTPSCYGDGDEKKSSSACCNISNSCQVTAPSCCGSDPKENLGFEEFSKNAKYMSEYIIPKMDCYAEEQIVRMALSDLGAVKGLAFDLPNRKLKVFHNEGVEQITSKLEGLGFGAKLDETQLSLGDLPNEPDPVKQAKVLKLLLGINALLFFIEFISGIIAASTGLIADSLDMFADAAVYGIALYAVGKAAKYQVKAAHFAGWIQLLLAVIVIVDVIRRFMFGSEPESTLMVVIGLLALIANVTCLYLISSHREDGVHMKASWIFSANDVVVNMGVIFAGVLVAWTGSAYPDLIIGILVSLFVLNGARKILALK